jgi:predicted house-cleaning noncanonical NTP pyrophosphatase (MazG superfamily)
VIVYNKLVRDGIPGIIRARGASCDVRTLSGPAYARALRLKLREEVEEYLESGALEELADICQVARALAALDGHSPEDLEAARARKEETRGGFAQRICLVSVTGPGEL